MYDVIYIDAQGSETSLAQHVDDRKEATDVARQAAAERGAGALLPHHFNLAGPPVADVGGVISVALSRGFPRVGVTDHRALWCPDFPRR